MGSRRTPRTPIRLHGTLLGPPAPQSEELKNLDNFVIFVEITEFTKSPGSDNVMVALVDREYA